MNKESVPQACAPCKHQRKKCDDNCELAPYFPASRMAEFQNAHRLFGVSNIQRLIASVEPHQRQRVADSIIMEGNLRSKHPVDGSFGIIRNLRSEIDSCKKELGIVNRYLAFFRQREKDQGPQKLDPGNFESETSESGSPTPPDSVRSTFLSLSLVNQSNEYVKQEEQGQRYNYMSTLDEDAELDQFGQEGMIMEFYQHDNLDHFMHLSSETGDDGHEKQAEKLSAGARGTEAETSGGEIIKGKKLRKNE